MRTLVISDLHLGSVTGSDVLRWPELRGPLLELAVDADRVVLLGDVLELRQGPPREALGVARGFFEELGAALAGRELVVTAGNHDYALIEPWLVARAEEDAPPRLGVEQLLEPAQASPMLARIAAWAAPARVLGAYPGLWLREDVYATHGHYLDCHLTVPTLERLSVGLMCRMAGRPVDTLASVEDYEAVSGPALAWRIAAARDAHTSEVLNGVATARAWRALRGAGKRAPARPGGVTGRRISPPRGLRTRALVGAFPLAVAALNRAGLGPLRAQISPTELRRAGLRAMGEVAARLELGDAFVIFGHTHRAGPLLGDDEREWSPVQAPAAQADPKPSSGARLINAGCWCYNSVFLSANAGESPYWPGTCVVVEDSGPPVLERLLLDRTHSQLKPIRA